MNAREQEEVVLRLLADESLTTARIRERWDGPTAHHLTVRQIAAALGRLRRRGAVRSTEMRCLVCDGRGRVRAWQRAADYKDES